MSRNGVIFSLPIWGSQHIQLAKDFLFPIMFSKKNLKALKKLSRFKFIISTDKASFLELSEIFIGTGLSEYEFEICLIDNSLDRIKTKKYGPEKYRHVTFAQNKVLNLAQLEHFKFFVPLYADFILPEDFIRNISQAFKTNKRVFLTLVPAVETKAMYNHLHRHLASIQNGHLTKSQIKKMIYKCLHPLFYLSIDGYSDDFHPIGPYIGIGNKESFDVKSMHYHPIYIRLTDNLIKPFIGTIDENLILTMELNGENTQFNTLDFITIASAMDSDFKMPYRSSSDHLSFYTDRIKHSNAIDQIKFLLQHTNNFHFRRGKRSKKNSIKLDLFTQKLFSQIDRKPLITKLPFTIRTLLIAKPILPLLSKIIPTIIKRRFARSIPLELLNRLKN